jgi:IS30 family transposase
LIERKSRYTVSWRVRRKTAKADHNPVTHGLSPHQDRVRTITEDNGREFADYEGMARDLETQIYFAHPYASWERGLN